MPSRYHLRTLAAAAASIAALVGCSAVPVAEPPTDGEVPVGPPSTGAPPAVIATTTTTPPAAPSTVPPPTSAAPLPAPTSSGPPGPGEATRVGSMALAVPAGAIIVAVSGNDANSGTAAAPVRTVARALSLAAPGATIVVRGGSYHESISMPANKPVTLQPWPNEAVWFDGSTTLTSWTPDGAAWRVDGWTVEFDNSPTFTRGAPDNTAAAWSFINPNAPMAAHPDQVWIDGTAQVQVGSRAEVRPGTFFKDGPNDRLYLGSDPTGREVRAGDLIRGLYVRSPGTIVRGIGFRRFNPSVPDMGALVVAAERVSLTDLVVTDMAVTGISVVSPNAILRNIEVARSGMLGIHANYADNFLAERVVSHHNNVEKFNSAPVSGGFKFSRMRGVTIRNSTFSDNAGPGLWSDQAVYGMTIVGSDFANNSSHGVSLELSAKALFADNLVSNNSGHGIKINNTSEVEIINNTFVRNGRSVMLAQDSRVATDMSVPGKDPRRPNPDPTMPWIVGPVLVQGNILSSPKSGNCLLCVEDYSQQWSAEDLGVQSPGNFYDRASTTNPTYLVVWSKGPGNPAVFRDLAPFSAATGQEARGGQISTGAPIVTLDGQPTGVRSISSGGPVLPASVAATLGHSSGSTRFGALR